MIKRSNDHKRKFIHESVSGVRNLEIYSCETFYIANARVYLHIWNNKDLDIRYKLYCGILWEKKLLLKYNDRFQMERICGKMNFIFQCILIDSVRVWNNWTSQRPSSTRRSTSLGPVPPRPAPRPAVDPPRPTWGPVSLSYSRNKSSVTEKGTGPKLETEWNTRDILFISLYISCF